LQQIVIRWL